MNYQRRQKKIQTLLAPNRLDALLVSHLPNVRYLCGFTGSAGALLITEKQSLFFTDGRYTTQAQEEVQGAKLVIVSQPPLLAAARWITGNKNKKQSWKIGIESEHLSVAARDRLATALPSFCRLRKSPPLVEQLRMIKDAQEMDCIRAAVQLGAGIFDTALKTIRPGVKETGVAAEMEYAAHKAGAQEMSFSTIIAAGERSALPHGRASAARIQARGFVVCDFGVILSGYCSDMTRTVYVGRPTAEERRTYDAVRCAQQASIDAVRPGASVGEVDLAGRKLLKKEGLAKYFTHSTGHGVGLEIHESPRIAAGQTEVLQPGMVITIEPGVYLPGKWGVRIEDMVLVTESGCEVLASTSKELITL
ncbi:MAG TPA: Xaa-Pro peptidase family protein [Terriglobales bacterium]|nr:Xaa-Pro peptidase family protein [Terriglobales bacterium]